MAGILVWGEGWDTRSLGLSETMDCGTCGIAKRFSARLTYRYTHVFWVFGRVRERHYEWVCSGCKAVIPADPGQIAGRLTSNPIPFLRRWGWLVYAGGGAMFVLYMMWNLVMNTP